MNKEEKNQKIQSVLEKIRQILDGAKDLFPNSAIPKVQIKDIANPKYSSNPTKILKRTYGIINNFNEKC